MMGDQRETGAAGTQWKASEAVSGCSREPFVQLLAYGEAAGQVQAVTELPPGRLGVRQRGLLVSHLLQQLCDV
ncbi:hypothetical protein A6A06_24625 [Streptomyces sp. CB02923]|nr:hypothetical protein A6A06_24625 [Streptomyces sp. CB02923]